MKNHDITEIQPVSVVKIIDDNLKEESAILKSLVEKVIDSNVKVKEKYLETIRDNENRLNEVISSSDTVQNAMRNTSKRQEQEWLSAFSKSQERIFDLNSRYRYFLINNLKESYSIDKFVNDIEAITNQLIENTTDLNRFTIDVYRQNIDNKKEYLEIVSDLAFGLSQSDIIIDEINQPHTVTFSDLLLELKQLFDEVRSLITQNEIFPKEWIDKLLLVNTEDEDNEKQTQDLLNRLINTQKEFFMSVKTKTLNTLNQIFQNNIDNESTKYIDLDTSIKEKLLEKSYYQTQDKDTSMIEQDINKLINNKARLTISKIERKAEKRAWIETNKQLKQAKRLFEGFIEQSYEWKKEYNIKNFELTKQLTHELFINTKQHNDNLYHTISKLLTHVKSMISRMAYHQEYLIHEIEKRSLQSIEYQEAYELFLLKMSDHVVHYRKHLKNTLDILVEENRYIHLFNQKQMLILNYHIERFDLIKKEIATAIKKTATDVTSNDLIAIEGLRRKEKLLSSIIENEILIENARNEYAIQVEKAKTFYTHDQSINEVQNYRLDSSVDVTKAMIKALIERQANFAKQQLLFTEEEYISRLRHIETLYNQEITYIKDQIELYRTPYLEQIEKKSNEHNIRLDEIRKRMKIFIQPKYLNKLKEEESFEIDAFEKAKRNITSDMDNDDTIVKYINQMNETLNQKQQALEDALNIRNKSLETFNDLKEDSESKLVAFEKTVELPKQLPIFDRETIDLSRQRLESALDYAQKLLNEKLEQPIKFLEELTKEYERFQNETDRVIIESNPNMVNINKLLDNHITKLDKINCEIELQNEKIILLIFQQNTIPKGSIGLDKYRTRYYKNQRTQLKKRIKKLKLKLLNTIQYKVIEINERTALVEKSIDLNENLQFDYKKLELLYKDKYKATQKNYRFMLKQFKPMVRKSINDLSKI